jgi:minor extracellular serine protease Vpr
MQKAAFIFFLFFGFHAYLLKAQPGKKQVISASTRQFLHNLRYGKLKENGYPSQYVYNRVHSGPVLVNAFLKVNDAFQEGQLRQLGAITGTRAGAIRTVRIPVYKVSDVCRLPGLLAIDMDQPAAPDLDSARRRTRVDSVHLGLGLPQAFNGDSVVLGIVDAGFDYTHPAFYDTTYTRYRVRRVWEQKQNGQAPAGFGYGAEYADSASIITKGYDISETIHGTHVGGIAGGSGYFGPNGNKLRYRGIAYKSDLVFVAMYPSPEYWLSTGMADMLDGVNYTFQYAASVGKPAVANLSWGCPLGPRDGNSLFSEAMDNLTGPGRIFVLSGGNNGQNKIHISKTFTASDTLLSTFTTFSASLNPKINKIDLWGDTGKTFQVRFTLFNGTTLFTGSPWIGLDDSTRQIPLVGTNGDTLFITVTGVAIEFNGKPHMLVQFLSRVPDRVGIQVKATDGVVHAWQGVVVNTSGYYGAFTKHAFNWASDGDVNYTTGDLVSTRSALAVAAYNSKVSYSNLSGQTLSYTGAVRGRIATFSSIGPTADGRVKPDIAGPGLGLASAVSSYVPAYQIGGANYSNVVAKFTSPRNNRVYSFAMAGGTSMSSPATSGIAAMLLQLNPALDPAGIKELLRKSAIRDGFTGAIPETGSTTWGQGKVNAMGAIRELLAPVTGIQYAVKNGHDALLYPNPGGNWFTFFWAGGELQSTEGQLLDATGRPLKNFGFFGEEFCFAMGEFPSGLYILRCIRGNEPVLIRFQKH